MTPSSGSCRTGEVATGLRNEDAACLTGGRPVPVPTRRGSHEREKGEDGRCQPGDFCQFFQRHIHVPRRRLAASNRRAARPRPMHHRGTAPPSPPARPGCRAIEPSERRNDRRRVGPTERRPVGRGVGRCRAAAWPRNQTDRTSCASLPRDVRHGACSKPHLPNHLVGARE